MKIRLACTLFQVAATSAILLLPARAESPWDPAKSGWTEAETAPFARTERPPMKPSSSGGSPSLGHTYIPEPGAALLGGIGILILLRRWRSA